MTSIHLTVTGARARASVTGPLTSGMVGIPVTIEYDEAWDGLTKNLMCRCSPWGSDDGENRAILNVGESAAVAHEVMQADMYLYLGVEGFSDDGKLVIPTTWAECGKIEYGANTCEDPTADPELSVWNQLQTEIEQIKGSALTQEQAADIQACAQEAIQAAREARQAADEAKQAANTGGSGLYYTPVVTQPTGNTLRFEFKPSVTGGPVPKPVTVELPVCGDSDENTSGRLTTEQIGALNGMFRAAGYDGDAAYAAAYAAFQDAFELGGDGSGEDSDVSNETAWTDGVPYTYDLVDGEYVKQTGDINTYDGWQRTPYLYCAGADRLDFTNTNSQQADYNAFFDADKVYVESFRPATTGGVEVPDTAAYFVCSGPEFVMAAFGVTPREAAA